MLSPGRRLGPYEIRAPLGSGGMGDVFLAFDTRLEREVALKVLTAADADALHRLTHEARLASRLAHPGICTVFEAGEIEGQAFIAMERVAGETLADLLARQRLAPERVCGLGAQMSAALAHAHEHGVIHRDFKSANVIVSPDGRIKILDFGLAVRSAFDQPDRPDVSAITREATASNVAGASLAGTLAYMPPEALRGGTVDARGDIWALGVVLFEMAVGRRPFEGKTPYDLTAAILTQPAPEMPGVSAGLQAIVLRCLAKNPGERYTRASEVQAALEAVQSSAAAAAPASTMSPGPGLRPSRRALTAILVAACVLIAVVAAWQWRSPGSGAPRIRAIAVLPLDNLSGDASQEFFADGMTEALITNLARLKDVDVISRTSVMQYKGTQKPLRQIARELSVDAVVEGSVVRAGDRVRVTAQLVEGATDRHLWANDYERDARDVLALQHDVAAAVAREVRATLVPGSASAAEARRVDPMAHDLYLKGRALVYRYNEPQIAEAIGLLERAIAIEPTYADAWAALAAAHSERGIWGKVDSRVTGTRAHEAVARALALDASNAEAYSVLGNISLVYDWDWIASERALRRSIEVAPGDAHAHQLLAVLLHVVHRFPESVAEAIVETRLDPASSLAWSSLSRMQYRARQFDAALDTSHHAIELDPSYVPNYARRADIFIALGRPDEALHWLDEGQKVGGATRRQIDGYGVAYALAGRRAQAEAAVRDLTSLAATTDQAAYALAMVETALGHHDAAIGWLERSYASHSANLFLVGVELKFDSLRSDPRFKDLLRRMRLPEQ